MPVTSLRKTSARPPEVAKIKIKIKIKIKSQSQSQSQSQSRAEGADWRNVGTGSKFAPNCSCSTRRGALDCRPL
ncbi:hypothetical protein D3C72_482050 [compost metagenome]